MKFFDEIYNKGFEAGVNKAKLENQEAQNRRLEDMLKYGKNIGMNEGYTKGYHDGYIVGYNEGASDTKAKEGIVDLPDNWEEMLKDEMEDDVSEAVS